MAKLRIQQPESAILADTRVWLASRKRALVIAGASALALVLLIVGVASGLLKVRLNSGGDSGHVSHALAAAAAPTCEGGGFDPAHPALSNLCKTYQKVCFDQGHVVSYDPAYSPANATSELIPKLDIAGIQYAWGGAADNGDKFRNALINYGALAFRPAGILEEDDLANPVFSNCTAVVMWTAWVHNFEESLSHLASRMWALSHDNKLGKGSVLVMGTPAGERLRTFWPVLLQPYTQHPILTFAEFSARNARGTEPLHGYGRCYETAHMCAFGDVGYFKGMFGAMQAAYEEHAASLPKPLPSGTFSNESDPSVLKVLIEHRNGTVRHLLNWKELVDECNAFQGWNLPQNGPWKRVECRETTFTNDVMHNLAAVRPADVLVAVHGSGCSNWLAMREGSSMLEIRPFEFGSAHRDWSDMFYPRIADSIEHKVHWYAVNIEDPALNEPSDREKQHVNLDDLRYRRDRHSRLPFTIMRDRLELIASVVRNRDEYLKLREGNRRYVELRPGGQIKPI